MAKTERVTDLRPARPGAEEAMLCGIGRLICGWGTLEARLEQKIAQLRQSAGEVRMTAARQRPTMAKLMAELRAIVSMRNRRNNVELVTISEIERVLQQVDKELKRLSYISPASPEYSVIVSYAETVADLPWRLGEER